MDQFNLPSPLVLTGNLGENWRQNGFVNDMIRDKVAFCICMTSNLKGDS